MNTEAHKQSSHTHIMIRKEEEGETEMTSEQQNADHELISTLPSSRGWAVPRLHNYHGFWCTPHRIRIAMAFRDRFKPRDTDVILISPPKSGTTWLKALAFATLCREDHSPFAHDHPLLRLNPHDCVPTAESVFWLGEGSDPDRLPSPRLLHTHMGLSALPESVIGSPCKIVYICRNPKATFVSLWLFCKELTASGSTDTLVSFDEAYEMYCRGESMYGPVWDHQLGYWGESLRRPEKVLFLKYEDVTEAPAENLRRLAEFVSRPFSGEEEMEGFVDGIVRLCSLENLSGAAANQKGDRVFKEYVVKNSSFFRKGKVGDWKNHLTPVMARRLDEITDQKLLGSGLSFLPDYC